MRDDARPFLIICLGVLFAVGFVAALARAQPHNHAELPLWLVTHPDFPWCCNKRDCELIDGRDLKPTAEGWVVTVRGIRYPPVAYSDTKLGRDGQHAVCIMESEHGPYVRCLYISPSGS